MVDAAMLELVFSHLLKWGCLRSLRVPVFGRFSGKPTNHFGEGSPEKRDTQACLSNLVVKGDGQRVGISWLLKAGLGLSFDNESFWGLFNIGPPRRVGCLLVSP